MRTIFLSFIVLISIPLFGRMEASPTSVQSRRIELENQLKDYERQITETENLVFQKSKEAESLQRDISILDTNIKLKKLYIKAQTLSVAKLEGQIGQKTQNIHDLETTIARNKVTLGESIRQLNEQDHRSAIELALEFNDLSSFFDAIESSKKLQNAIQGSVEELSRLKGEEESTRTALENDKEEEIQLKTLQELEKKGLERQETQKNSLLKITKGKESEYKKILSNKQKKAASIRSQLFLLQGSPSISFEKALGYANAASRLTGVRAAYILAIISQESDLGRNIGQCNLPNDPPTDLWRAVMKASRDIEPYLAITAELGLDPDKMPVSCPLRDKNHRNIGWGGAMGPAQFIPSTWILYKTKVAQLVGHNPANPWNPQDAFVASALLSQDNGAVGGRENEKIAAAKYFAGNNWKSSLGKSYANQVLAKADIYQEQIDLLQSIAQR